MIEKKAYKEIAERARGLVNQLEEAGDRRSAALVLRPFSAVLLKPALEDLWSWSIPRRLWDKSREDVDDDSPSSDDEPDPRGRPSKADQIRQAWEEVTYPSYEGDARYVRGGQKRPFAKQVAAKVGCHESTAWKHADNIRISARYTDLCSHCEKYRSLRMVLLQKAGVSGVRDGLSLKEVGGLWEREGARAIGGKAKKLLPFETHLKLVGNQERIYKKHLCDTEADGTLVICDWSTVVLKAERGLDVEFFQPECIAIFGVYCVSRGQKFLRVLLFEPLDALGGCGKSTGAALDDALSYFTSKKILLPNASVEIWVDSSRKNFHNQYFLAAARWASRKLKLGRTGINYFGNGHGKSVLDQTFSTLKRSLGAEYASIEVIKSHLLETFQKAASEFQHAGVVWRDFRKTPPFRTQSRQRKPLPVSVIRPTRLALCLTGLLAGRRNTIALMPQNVSVATHLLLRPRLGKTRRKKRKSCRLRPSNSSAKWRELLIR